VPAGPLEAELAADLELMLRELVPRFYHTHDSRRSVAGFPDYCLVVNTPSGPQLLFLELKREGGRPTPEQVGWLRSLAQAGALAMLAGGRAGVAAVVRFLEELRKGRRISPAALGRVWCVGDLSPNVRRLFDDDTAVVGSTSSRRPRPDIRPRRRGS